MATGLAGEVELAHRICKIIIELTLDVVATRLANVLPCLMLKRLLVLIWLLRICCSLGKVIDELTGDALRIKLLIRVHKGVLGDLSAMEINLFGR